MSIRGDMKLIRMKLVAHGELPSNTNTQIAECDHGAKTSQEATDARRP